MLGLNDTDPLPPPPRRSWIPWIILGILVVGLGFGIAWKVRRDRAEQAWTEQMQANQRNALRAADQEITQLQGVVDRIPQTPGNEIDRSSAKYQVDLAVSRYKKLCAKYTGPWPTSEPKPGRSCPEP